ncbi:MAG: glycosyltransferase family 9 protein [Chlamydiales bacterium]
MKTAVLSCMGLGDGLISLILSQNLYLNGWQPVTFHPFLSGLQSWFPHLPIASFPAEEKIAATFDEFEKIFLFYEKSPGMLAILKYCEERCPEKLTVLNPIATPNRDYPYWENGRFDGNYPFAENLFHYCKDVLKLKKTSLENGIQPPSAAIARAHPERVILHPMSSRDGKNWPKEKFVELSSLLVKGGYEPKFILTQQEKEAWKEFHIDAPAFSSLNDLAHFIYESGYMIGNDSGIGHLASCLGVPTLTICRNIYSAKFWRPAWTHGEVIFPSPLVPNLKLLRWRDRHWKRWISVPQVMKRFKSLAH